MAYGYQVERLDQLELLESPPNDAHGAVDIILLLEQLGGEAQLDRRLQF